MNDYQKRGAYTTLEEYVLAKTGESIEELGQNRKYEVQGLSHAAAMLQLAKRRGTAVYLYTDSDLDGSGAMYIGCRIAERLHLKRGANFFPSIQNNAEHGCGLSLKYIDQVRPGSLLITGDLGITSVAAIEKAKRKNVQVMVLDHHLAGAALPPADLIIDPAAIPDDSDFTGYCGAGLFFKLYRLLFPNSEYSDVLCTAAVSTLADGVPLLQENRWIVKSGLKYLNAGLGCEAYIQLLQQVGILGCATEDTLTKYIIPVLNAGRMNRNGAQHFVDTMLMPYSPDLCRNISGFIQANQIKKEKLWELHNALPVDPGAPINFLIAPDGYQGLYGSAAAWLAEKTGKPTFVIRDDHHNHYNGSARSDNSSVNSVMDMLSSVSDLITSYGGHPAAAGFSMNKDVFEEVKKRLESYPLQVTAQQRCYDLDFPMNIEGTLHLLQKLEPFGRGFEKPVFRMRVHVLPDQVRYLKKAGSDSEHLMFFLYNKFTAILFNQAKQYRQDGEPKELYLYGTITRNVRHGELVPQMITTDYEIVKG